MTTVARPPTGSPSSRFSCCACGHHVPSRTEEATERMFGLGGCFPYDECASCGAWNLREVPADLDRYYPEQYATFTDPRQSTAARTWQDRLLDIDLGAPASLVRKWVPDRQARILDVGTGNGRCLLDLWRAGYRELLGVDPRIPPYLEQQEPFVLRRGNVHDCPGGWDVIMYHHVLEHVRCPSEELRAAAALLAPGGLLIIRVPLADSWARRRFSTCWLQWDAPRHLWLPTRAAVRHLATRSNLTVVCIVDDSRSFQVWMSRLYRRGLSPTHPECNGSRRRQYVFAFPLLVASRLWSRWLNLRGDGDQAAFVLKKPA